MYVPEEVPSVSHSSLPLTPSVAVKKSVLPTAVRLAGPELPAPARMSAVRTVPAEVPSLCHNSRP